MGINFAQAFPLVAGVIEFLLRLLVVLLGVTQIGLLGHHAPSHAGDPLQLLHLEGVQLVGHLVYFVQHVLPGLLVLVLVGGLLEVFILPANASVLAE